MHTNRYIRLLKYMDIVRVVYVTDACNYVAMILINLKHFLGQFPRFVAKRRHLQWNFVCVLQMFLDFFNSTW